MLFLVLSFRVTVNTFSAYLFGQTATSLLCCIVICTALADYMIMMMMMMMMMMMINK